LLVLALVGPASARVITVKVEGVVNSVNVGGRFALDGSVGVGSAMKGFRIYDRALSTEEIQQLYQDGL